MGRLGAIDHLVVGFSVRVRGCGECFLWFWGVGEGVGGIYHLVVPFFSGWRWRLSFLSMDVHIHLPTQGSSTAPRTRARSTPAPPTGLRRTSTPTRCKCLCVWSICMHVYMWVGGWVVCERVGWMDGRGGEPHHARNTRIVSQNPTHQHGNKTNRCWRTIFTARGACACKCVFRIGEVDRSVRGFCDPDRRMCATYPPIHPPAHAHTLSFPWSDHSTKRRWDDFADDEDY